MTKNWQYVLLNNLSGFGLKFKTVFINFAKVRNLGCLKQPVGWQIISMIDITVPLTDQKNG